VFIVANWGISIGTDEVLLFLLGASLTFFSAIFECIFSMQITLLQGEACVVSWRAMPHRF
jgi:hypothetical protein